MSVDGVFSRGISNIWSTTSSIFSKSYSISNHIYGTTILEEVNIVFDKSTKKAINAEEIIKNVTDQVNGQQSLNQ